MSAKFLSGTVIEKMGLLSYFGYPGSDALEIKKPSAGRASEDVVPPSLPSSLFHLSGTSDPGYIFYFFSTNYKNLSKGPVKLIQRMKIAHSFLESVSNLFHFIILSLAT